VAAIERICVYCGSSPGVNGAYREAAARLGRELAQAGVGVVYGGASVGLMGAVADAALAAGGEVVGVIPQALVDRELAHPGLTELHVVGSMHERKALMAERADAFVALPGGAGTLEELFETFTWAQLGLHRKPLALLDVAGFYAGLVAFLDHLVHEGFLAPRMRELLLLADDARALLARLAAWEPPGVDRWLRVEET
jgi:uncharacterized protein (TIGR00730 family)